MRDRRKQDSEEKGHIINDEVLQEQLSKVLLDLIFLKEVSFAYQDCIYLIKNTVKTVIVKYYQHF